LNDLAEFHARDVVLNLKKVFDMSQWFEGKKKLLAGACLFLIIAGLGAWILLYQTLPGGVWHQNRITGATCYITVHCWTQGKDPFGKGLKLPTDPFGKNVE
jgi:hypothetical protein